MTDVSPDLDGFDPGAWPRRLNLGCGFDRRDGYLNVDLHDFHHPDLVGDVRSLPMLPTGGYDEVLAIDVLEHLRREDGPVALCEWARLLEPGGRLVLRVPNLLALARLLYDDREDLDRQRVLLQCLFGTQAYDGDFHLNGYTEMLLRDELRLAGFDCVSVEPKDEWLFDVVAVRVEEPAEVRLGDCRFMELRTPSDILANPAVGGGVPATAAGTAAGVARRLRSRAGRLIRRR
jgi:SAM-dependent methyltransferase